MHVVIYRTRRPIGRQRYRWRAVADNGRIVAVGGEAYTNLGDCERIVAQLFGDHVQVFRGT